MTRRDDRGLVTLDTGQPVVVSAPPAADTSAALDPRWDWITCPEFDGTTHYVRGFCRHLEAVPVESVGGEIVAYLCTTCDTQLPEEWRP